MITLKEAQYPKERPSVKYQGKLVEASRFGRGEFMQICRDIGVMSEDTLLRIWNAYADLKMIFGYKGLVNRQSGEPYYHHPKGVALIDILEFENRNPEQLIAELHHDSDEDSLLYLGTTGHPDEDALGEMQFTDLDVLRARYSEEAGKIILALTNLKSIKPKNKMSPGELEAYLHALFSRVLNRYPEVRKKAAQAKTCDRMQNNRTEDLETDRGVEKAARKLVESYRYVVPIAEIAGEKYRTALLAELDQRKGILTPAQAANLRPVRYHLAA